MIHGDSLSTTKQNTNNFVQSMLRLSRVHFSLLSLFDCSQIGDVIVRETI